MTHFHWLMAYDAVGMLLLFIFTLVVLAFGKGRWIKTTVCVYSLLQFILFLVDLLYTADLQ